MAYVYLHQRLDTNEIFYVGIGTDNKFQRAKNKSRRTEFWKNVIKKTEYKIIIFINDISIEDACNEEIRLIKHYGRRDLNEGTLVNMDNGGKIHLHRNVSETTRQKISNTLKVGNHKTTPKLNPDIVKDICEKILIGYTKNDLIMLYPQLTKGVFFQIYHKKTWKEITSNYDFPILNRSYVVSNETKKTISKKLKGQCFRKTIKVKCLDDNLVFGSITEAAKYYNIKYSQIFNMLGNNKKKYKNSVKLRFEIIE